MHGEMLHFTGDPASWILAVSKYNERFSVCTNEADSVDATLLADMSLVHFWHCMA